MKIGENVMVKVSRDRERGGVVAGFPSEGTVEVVFDGMDLPACVHENSVRATINNTDISLVNKGGTKHDTGKNRIELIPYEAIEQIGLALTFGAKKYEDENWRKGFKWKRIMGALLRHTLSWSAGEDKDPESGLSHLAHAGACLCFLITHEQLGYGEDDRVKTKSN